MSCHFSDLPYLPWYGYGHSMSSLILRFFFSQHLKFEVRLGSLLYYLFKTRHVFGSIENIHGYTDKLWFCVAPMCVPADAVGRD
jgi:hypothetical protein